MNYYEEIYSKYGQMIYRYLYGLCRNADIAEDLTQDTFLKAIEKSGSFEGQSSVSTWLCTIARNRYMDYLKKKENRHLPLEICEEISDEKSGNFSEEVISKEDTKKILLVLHKLPEPYKEVFMLRVYGELPFKEIANIFGKTDEWARVTFRRAREKLMAELEEI